jgi:tetratricopeptide (TPR) repeat protein
MTVSLGEMLGLRTTGGQVLELMANGRRALEQGLILSAIEECYRAIELAPFYLPAHQRLAELLATEGRLEEAATKYGIIAQTYRERGDTTHAIAACMSQLRLSPLELGTQETLIALLLQRGQLDLALEQTMALADAYYQLAQVDKAAETYREALKLASRTGSRQVAVRVLHRLGDIDTQRLDWQSAAVVYKQVRRLAPDDERAMEALIELYLKLGQSQRALAELDTLLHLHKDRGNLDKARSFLADLAANYPEETGIRDRLKAVGSRR